MNKKRKPIGSNVRVSKGSLWGSNITLLEYLWENNVTLLEYLWENKVTLGGNVEGRIKKGETPIYDDTLYVSGYCSEDKVDYILYRGKELLGVFIEDYETNGVNYYSWCGVPGSRKEFYSKLKLELDLEVKKYEQRLWEKKHE
jgi:hypothetical protein